MRELVTTRDRSDTSVPLEDQLFDTTEVTGCGKYTYGYYDKTVVDLGVVETESHHRNIKDNLTADYKARQAAGEIMMNDFQRTSTNTLNPKGQLQWDYTSYNYGSDYNVLRTKDQLITDLFPSTYWTLPKYTDFQIDEFRNEALLKLYSEIGNAPMQLLVSAAEFHKSVATIRRCLTAVWRNLKRVHRTRRLLVKGSITAASAASVWLECRYGLRPIFYDVVAAIDAINAVCDGPRKRFNASVSVDDIDDSIASVQYAGQYAAKANKHAMAELTVRAGAIVEPRLLNRVVVNDAFGLNLHDIPSSVWEVVPYSFIIDWFIQVGDFIAAWTPRADISILGSWVSIQQSTSVGLTAYEYQDKRSSSVTVNRYANSVNVAGSISSMETTRYANPSIPRFPARTIKVNASKYVDLLAIIYSMNPRKWRI